ncbi:TPA: virulence RhuM family protein [Mannheimia haemolytica]|nr:virulence RhuM family protein [Mannheimia haemolytica]
MKNPIEIYQSQDGKTQVSVQFDKETVWLSQAQMASIFDTSSDNISLHLKNIFAEGELDENATTEDFSVVRQEETRQVTRQLKHYNLDAIISVGYRVKSSSATQFRIWATARLKDYLVKGYALNERCLQERGIEFEQVIGLLSQYTGCLSLVGGRKFA